MFDKLEGLVDRLDTVLQELNDPDVASNQNRFRDLMKEQNDLTPIVEAYKEYKNCKQNIEDSLSLLEEESDEEMKELAKEGMTMVCVTHEMGFARNVSNKVVFMENGVVVEEGPSKEFFANPREERTRTFLQNIEQHYE